MKENIAYVKDKNDLNYPNEELRVSFRKKNQTPTSLEFGFFLDKVESVFPKDYYIAGFISGLFFRPNCFKCPYASPERCSDITIGDFWGLGSKNPSDMNVEEGVSEVLINNQKGHFFFEELKPLFKYEKREIEEAVRGNGQLNNPFPKPKSYDDFHILYRDKGYLIACRKYIRRYKLSLHIKRVKDLIIRIFPCLSSAKKLYSLLMKN